MQPPPSKYWTCRAVCLRGHGSPLSRPVVCLPKTDSPTCGDTCRPGTRNRSLRSPPRPMRLYTSPPVLAAPAFARCLKITCPAAAAADGYGWTSVNIFCYGGMPAGRPTAPYRPVRVHTVGGWRSERTIQRCHFITSAVSFVAMVRAALRGCNKTHDRFFFGTAVGTLVLLVPETRTKTSLDSWLAYKSKLHSQYFRCNDARTIESFQFLNKFTKKR